MESVRFPKRGWLHGLGLTAMALAPLTVGPTPLLAAAQVRAAGCNLASRSPGDGRVLSIKCGPSWLL
jgi:hypothetical protein